MKATFAGARHIALWQLVPQYFTNTPLCIFLHFYLFKVLTISICSSDFPFVSGVPLNKDIG
jgi:hypothetical protein